MLEGYKDISTMYLLCHRYMPLVLRGGLLVLDKLCQRLLFEGMTLHNMTYLFHRHKRLSMNIHRQPLIFHRRMSRLLRV